MASRHRKFSAPALWILNRAKRPASITQALVVELAEHVAPTSSVPHLMSPNGFTLNAARTRKVDSISNPDQVNGNIHRPSSSEIDTQVTTNPMPATSGLIVPAQSKKTVQLVTNMVDRAGGGNLLFKLLQELEAEGFWSGKFATERNMRLVQKFLGIPRQKGDKHNGRSASFISITTHVIDWWVREGPLIVPISNGGSNRRFAGKGTQFQFFVESVLRDRDDAKSVDEYERAASNLGQDAYFGQLVKRIVLEACRIQKQPYPSTTVDQKGGEKIQGLKAESLKIARERVMGVEGNVLALVNAQLDDEGNIPIAHSVIKGEVGCNQTETLQALKRKRTVTTEDSDVKRKR